MPVLHPPFIPQQASEWSNSILETLKSPKNEVALHQPQETASSPIKVLISPKKNVDSEIELPNKVEIHSSGTTVFVADESRPHSSTVNQHTPRSRVSPNHVKFRKPAIKLNLNDPSTSPGFSNSKHFAKTIISAQSSAVSFIRFF